MRKRYLAEFIGTFVIVFVPVAVAAVGSLGDAPGLLLAAFASGLPVLAMISAFGPISAAHFNPAVTLGFALAGRFSWRHVLPYWLAQFSGAAAAGFACAQLYAAGPGSHIPASPDYTVRNFGTEFIITFILMLVIIAVATDRRVKGSTAALAIGMTVIFGVLIGGPVTGGSMNPARSLGPALFAGAEALQVYWLYLLAPMLGAAAGALAYEAVRLHPEEAVSAPADLA